MTKTVFCSILVGIRAYDRCWFLGDSFGSRSFEQYFQARKSIEYNGYVKANFDTTGFFGNTFISENPSMIGRICNLLVHGLKCQLNGKLLPPPKIVVIVLDDDIIHLFDSEDGILSDNTDSQGISTQFSRILNYIMSSFERCIAAFKEHLPAKSLKASYPKFLWIQAPLHDNFKNNSLRFKLNRCLEEVTKLHSNCHTLHLKRVWDPKNLNLFLLDSQRYTAEGLSVYWEAVDRTVQYFDSVMLKKLTTVPKRKHSFQDQKDRFKWQNLAFNRNENVSSFKKLPPPPPVRMMLLRENTDDNAHIYKLLLLYCRISIVMMFTIFENLCLYLFSFSDP